MRTSPRLSASLGGSAFGGVPVGFMGAVFVLIGVEWLAIGTDAYPRKSLKQIGKE